MTREYVTIAKVTLPGSNVTAELLRSDATGDHFYTIDIDGVFYDGNYCTVAEGIDVLCNPFNVKRVVTSAEHYDAIDRDFEHCYSRT